MRTTTLTGTALAAVLLLSAACGSGPRGGGDAEAAAADFPARPITLVVPYGAGGSTDTIARVLADHLERSLGQPVAVENVPGGVGAVGVQRVFNAEPDGHTLAMASGSILTVTPQTTELEYDPMEMTFVASTHESVAARFVSGESQWQTIEDLVAWGAQEGNELVDATSGGFGVNDIGTASLSEAVGGLNYRPLATDGGAEAVVRILAGDADMNQNSATAALPYVESGELRPLLIESPSWPELAELGVPTSQELYGYTIINPSAVLAPPDLPDEIRQVLEDAIRDALEDEEVAERMRGTFELVGFRSGADAQEYAQQAYDSYTPIIEAMGAGIGE
ncbi:tripartite tricarboxylate transporter substrate binding protein [Jiangella asiatica]|uniref:Tripartite tricarboxylate transporter substrate binding protein n=1 Tax=Jiangella asiatica TaxID=2530372 RepID=A0A4V2Z129_9ACTN|nr:tripartite tricarboxylate transporter substrate binding protein [Jiangella asiatica]TDE03128.1 tripartite tricarboxylate transporter substrate binding protein [Jiangella asiatica]